MRAGILQNILVKNQKSKKNAGKLVMQVVFIKTIESEEQRSICLHLNDKRFVMIDSACSTNYDKIEIGQWNNKIRWR